MKAYRKALLNVEEFVLNADIANASDVVDLHGQHNSSGLDTVGVEFEIVANGNDEI